MIIEDNAVNSDPSVLIYFYISKVYLFECLRKKINNLLAEIGRQIMQTFHSRVRKVVQTGILNFSPKSTMAWLANT